MLAAILRGEPCAWEGRHRNWTDEDFFERAGWHRVTSLVARQLRTTAAGDGCPATIRDAAERRATKIAAREALRRGELRRVFSAFEEAGIRPILFKGTALAYTRYPHPSLRERCDSDLFVPSANFAAVERTLVALGYKRRLPLGDGATIQQAWFQMRDRYGLEHALDVHWRISNRPLLMDLVSYEELVDRAESAPSLHRWAIAPSALDALMLASVHRVTHHDNAVDLVWLYDIDLLMRELGIQGLEEFRRLAEHKGVSAICAAAIAVTVESLNGLAAASGGIMDWRADAAGRREPTAMYLSHRPWFGDQAISDFLTQRSWRARLRYAGEIVLPSTQYMLARYGVENRALVPFLHIWRLVSGMWKLAGRVARDLGTATSMKVTHEDIV
jgi:hypothetical protein